MKRFTPLEKFEFQKYLSVFNISLLFPHVLIYYLLIIYHRKYDAISQFPLFTHETATFSQACLDLLGVKERTYGRLMKGKEGKGREGLKGVERS